MATVYRPYVGERVGAKGLPVWVDSGEEVVIEGRTLVRISHNVILDNRDQWFETREEATVKARLMVADVANTLAEQLASLEKEI